MIKKRGLGPELARNPGAEAASASAVAAQDCARPQLRVRSLRLIPLAPTHLGFICPEHWFIHNFTVPNL